jgi:hypothetical protein
LIDRIPEAVASGCDASVDVEGSPATGSVEALECVPDADAELAGVRRIRYWSYPDTPALDAQWESVLTAESDAPETRASVGGCWDGTPGVTTHLGGRVQCDIRLNGTWTIWWDDAEHLVFGMVEGRGVRATPDDRIATLLSGVEWWQGAAVLGGTGPVFDPGEQVLLEAMPEAITSTCFPRGHTSLSGYEAPSERRDVTGIPYPDEDIAAIICYPDDPRVIYVASYLYANRPNLREHFQRFFESSLYGPCPEPQEGGPLPDRYVVRCATDSGAGVTMLRWRDSGPEGAGPWIYGLLNTDASLDEGGAQQWWIDTIVRE